MKTFVSAAILLLVFGQTVLPSAAPVDVGIQPGAQQERTIGEYVRAEPAAGPVSRDPAAVPQQWATVLPQQETGTDLVGVNDALASLLNAAQQQAGGPTLWEQACGAVLVVPAPELAAESLAPITEDMMVMCHILDKAVAPPLAGRATLRANSPSTRLIRGATRTQGLYLSGYGALFFLEVDFPLRPALPEQAPPQDKPATDPVWSQTVDELRGLPADSGRAAAPAMPYDARKVESLQTTLIKSLRHAANMRLAAPQDFITLVVGQRDSRRSTPYDVSGTWHTRTERNGVVWHYGTAPAGEAQAETAGVLILRAGKANIDTFAAGKLTLEQFTEKTQTLWSSTERSPTEPPAPATRTAVPQKR